MRKGFTLAEVLITLVIIGVIAALTIPTLMQNMNEKATVTKLKKAFTTLNNATLAAVAENGSIDTWGLTADGVGAIKFNNYIKPYLKVIKDCTNSSGCWTEGYTYKLNGDRWITNMNTASAFSKMILNDGQFLAMCVNSANCGLNRSVSSSKPLNDVCGMFTIDIDGYKGENTRGKDIFTFWITNIGQIIPFGTADDSTDSITSCNKQESGGGCTAWVIYKENMDYLKGKTVFW